jgi:hypothetical protein
MAVPFINFLIRILCSKKYRTRLDLFMRLGHVKAAELIMQRQATDAKLASEPGMSPDGTIIQPE